MVELRLCEYHKKERYLAFASEYFCGGFPKKIEVKSHYTGRVVEFVPVEPSDTLLDEDGWDGEQQIYRPVQHLNNVEYLVVYHQW